MELTPPPTSSKSEDTSPLQENAAELLARSPPPMDNRHDVDVEPETSDDEVKVNCIGGYRGLTESDFSDSDQEEDATGPEANLTHLVQFSNGVGASSLSSGVQPVLRPIPERVSPKGEVVLRTPDNSESTPILCESSSHDFSDTQTTKSKQTAGDVAPLSPNTCFTRQVDRLSSQFKSLGGMTLVPGKELDGAAKPKRALSFNTLAVLDAEARSDNDSPKRLRICIEPEDAEFISCLIPDDSTSECADGENVDASDVALYEELKRRSSMTGGDNSPVPLLTPPQSPRPVLDDDDAMCLEWPSNLVLDNAMMRVNSIRPLSPTSLQKLEESEDERLKAAYSNPDPASVGTLLKNIYIGLG